VICESPLQRKESILNFVLYLVCRLERRTGEEQNKTSACHDCSSVFVCGEN
jgi:hypothetical protein